MYNSTDSASYINIYFYAVVELHVAWHRIIDCLCRCTPRHFLHYLDGIAWGVRWRVTNEVTIRKYDELRVVANPIYGLLQIEKQR